MIQACRKPSCRLHAFQLARARVGDQLSKVHVQLLGKPGRTWQNALLGRPVSLFQWGLKKLMTFSLSTNGYSRISRSNLVEFILTVSRCCTLQFVQITQDAPELLGQATYSGLIKSFGLFQVSSNPLNPKNIADLAYDPHRTSPGTSQLYIDVAAPEELRRH